VSLNLSANMPDTLLQLVSAGTERRDLSIDDILPSVSGEFRSSFGNDNIAVTLTPDGAVNSRLQINALNSNSRDFSDSMRGQINFSGLGLANSSLAANMGALSIATNFNSDGMQTTQIGVQTGILQSQFSLTPNGIASGQVDIATEGRSLAQLQFGEGGNLASYRLEQGFGETGQFLISSTDRGSPSTRTDIALNTNRFSLLNSRLETGNQLGLRWVGERTEILLSNGVGAQSLSFQDLDRYREGEQVDKASLILGSDNREISDRVLSDSRVSLALDGEDLDLAIRGRRVFQEGLAGNDAINSLAVGLSADLPAGANGLVVYSLSQNGELQSSTGRIELTSLPAQSSILVSAGQGTRAQGFQAEQSQGIAFRSRLGKATGEIDAQTTDVIFSTSSRVGSWAFNLDGFSRVSEEREETAISAGVQLQTPRFELMGQTILRSNSDASQTNEILDTRITALKRFGAGTIAYATYDSQGERPDTYRMGIRSEFNDSARGVFAGVGLEATQSGVTAQARLTGSGYTILTGQFNFAAEAQVSEIYQDRSRDTARYSFRAENELFRLSTVFGENTPTNLQLGIYERTATSQFNFNGQMAADGAWGLSAEYQRQSGGIGLQAAFRAGTGSLRPDINQELIPGTRVSGELRTPLSPNGLIGNDQERPAISPRQDDRGPSVVASVRLTF
jgi:hypothetical protein